MKTFEELYNETLNSLIKRIEKDGRDAVYSYIAGYRKDTGTDYYTVGEVYDSIKGQKGEHFEILKDLYFYLKDIEKTKK